jgi:hypothetical protein
VTQRHFPSHATLNVHEERVLVLHTRLERLSLGERGMEAMHEARELLTILQGWEAARRAGLRSAAPDDADRQTVYRRINALNDTVDSIERDRGVAP